MTSPEFSLQYYEPGKPFLHWWGGGTFCLHIVNLIIHWKNFFITVIYKREKKLNSLHFLIAVPIPGTFASFHLEDCLNMKRLHRL